MRKFKRSGDVVMQVKRAFELFELVEKKTSKDYKPIICLNMRKFRKEKYMEFKAKHKDDENPYSVDNISALLGISKVHYKRLENVNDKCKYINLDKLIILSIIYDKSLDEFLKK